MKIPNIVSYLAPSALTLACLSSGWSVSAHAYHPDTQTHAGMVVSPQYKEGELLVKFKSNVRRAPSMADGSNSVPEVDHFVSLPEESWKIAQLKPGSDTLQAKERLANHPDVESVEFNYRVTVAQIPNDPRFSEQWSLDNNGQTGGTANADIDAPHAWDITSGSKKVVVAVIDTGVDYTHEDLRANMWVNPGEIPDNGIDDDGNGYIDDVYGYDFYNKDGNPSDDYGHGTHVAGIISATGNNGIGISGVSWDAKIMAVKFIGANGYGYISDAVLAINYATSMGAKVINASWSGGSYSQALYDVIAQANTAGVLFVAAAGSEYTNTDFTTLYPASYKLPNVVSVTATDKYDNKADWANYGTVSVDIGAPGVDILSTVPRGSCTLCDSTGYLRASGTSMAAPHVAGAAALLLSQMSASPAELKLRLTESADKVSSLDGLTACGGRRVNADRAVRNLVTRCAGLVDPSLPDLALSHLTGPVSVKAGGVITLHTQLDNLGNSWAPFGLTVFALSKDPIITKDDLLLGVDYRMGIAAGMSTPLGAVLDIPKNVVPGLYYLGGVVNFLDLGLLVPETNELNNISNLIQIEVLAP